MSMDQGRTTVPTTKSPLVAAAPGCPRHRSRFGLHAAGRALAAVCLLAAAQSSAQMVSPSIDREPGPFSYFAEPTDEIGAMDAESATEVTPEGYLYTGYGELMFFAGEPLAPVEQRIKTLEQDFLPILHYTYRRDGIAYDFTVFAATLDGTAGGCLVNFVRVAMRNESVRRTRADIAVGTRYQNDSNTPSGKGDHRFLRPAEAQHLGGYRQSGDTFHSDWTYRFDGNAFLRGGKLVYLFPDGFADQAFTLKQSYNSPPDLTPRRLDVLPTTPVGIVHYQRMLEPGAEASLVFKMPVAPLAPGTDLDRLRAADFDRYLALTIDAWRALSERGLQIEVPEPKVVNTFKASLFYDLIARDRIGGHYIQTVNKLHYHEFFLRDGADIARMYDVTGHPDIAREVLDFFASSQQADGNFLSQEQQYDGWGEALWAYGQHYRLTRDRAFAKEVLPAIRRAVAWLHEARARDPLHLMPASDVRDNEYVPGHLTGHNFLALAGLKNAIFLADAIGAVRDAIAFRLEYDDYLHAFLPVLRRATAATHGYIPPALDGQLGGQLGGQDWGNLLSVYPEQILAPHDPRVTATLNETWAKYQEGLITYGDGRYLHHYLTIKNTLTEVIRGDQEQAVRELYALLVHTSSTHAGFEFAIRP
jgi:hypothetical protein